MQQVLVLVALGALGVMCHALENGENMQYFVIFAEAIFRIFRKYMHISIVKNRFITPLSTQIIHSKSVESDSKSVVFEPNTTDFESNTTDVGQIPQILSG